VAIRERVTVLKEGATFCLSDAIGTTGVTSLATAANLFVKPSSMTLKIPKELMTTGEALSHKLLDFPSYGNFVDITKHIHGSTIEGFDETKGFALSLSEGGEHIVTLDAYQAGCVNTLHLVPIPTAVSTRVSTIFLEEAQKDLRSDITYFNVAYTLGRTKPIMTLEDFLASVLKNFGQYPRLKNFAAFVCILSPGANAEDVQPKLTCLEPEQLPGIRVGSTARIWIRNRKCVSPTTPCKSHE